MIVEGLTRSGSEEARLVAQDIAVKWIRTNYVAYIKTGAMHEKYDVDKCGGSGGGGEYAPQVSHFTFIHDEELILSSAKSSNFEVKLFCF